MTISWRALVFLGIIYACLFFTYYWLVLKNDMFLLGLTNEDRMREYLNRAYPGRSLSPRERRALHERARASVLHTRQRFIKRQANIIGIAGCLFVLLLYVFSSYVNWHPVPVSSFWDFLKSFLP
ncbi:hypothetical protein [Desulfovibrio inopinatus]|uniref:hypothetical protein n=1 Tax=Desulfovibrio inopinatus TaxID=102109 RepID=UPI0003F5841C|nr:hypothetical protein [Desulfovibrio inopinatus]